MFHRTLRLLTALSRGCKYSSTLTSVKNATGDDTQHLNKSITVTGWVKSVRKQKELVFIDLNDGSSLRSLQVVAPSDQLPLARAVTLGCSLRVGGRLQESTHSGQTVELLANHIHLLGQCDPQEYPFKARKQHSSEYIRQFPHLRSRTKSFSSLLRLRDGATAAVHQFFRERGFISVHTPILTSSDCEGAGDLFLVKPNRAEGSCEEGREFFGSKAFLTVSGQLHAEAVACGMSSVYTFGPTFRAEQSHTRRHLSEFHMIEAEVVVQDTRLNELLQLITELYTHTVKALISENGEDLQHFHEQSQETKDWVMQSLTKPFPRMTYTEAMGVLKKAHDTNKFEFDPIWGHDLQSEHEQYLVSHCNHLPLFITDYPASIKPFYSRENEDQKTVSAVDLLVPGVGELVGGALREERYDILVDKLRRLEMVEPYQWYLDLRRYGTVPHGGFGLGFERLLQALLGVEHIRDVTPFPRFMGSCDM